jgi:antitoxin ParD1/3/4
MTTMNIAIPAELRKYVEKRVAAGGYGSVSEYMRELIRNDQRQLAQTVLEGELLRGLASGPAERMTTDDWSAIRGEVKRRIRPRKSR